MVELANKNNVPGVDQVTAGVTRMLDAGVDKAELLSMFQTIVDQHETVSHSSVESNGYDEHTVFTELPNGLIDLPTAVKKYNLRSTTVHTWLSKGHITLRGRLKGPAVGGGFIVVAEDELVAYISAPRDKGGRPTKKKARPQYLR